MFAGWHWACLKLSTIVTQDLAQAQVSKLDWLVLNAALFGVMFAGVDVGVGIAIGASFIKALLETVSDRITVLGRLPDTGLFRSVALFANLILMS